MITVEVAKSILAKQSIKLGSVELPIEAAAGKILAKDIRATCDMPRFNQSAVDGYAIVKPAKSSNLQFTVVQEIKAGDPPISRPKRNVAYRIFTGAPIPAGTFCVVMQEHVTTSTGSIQLTGDLLKQGRHIRWQGGNFGKGSIVLKKGMLLNPAAIGLLSSMGFKKVSVIRNPEIGLLVTGNELVVPGKKLALGQIYESNSATLKAALVANGFSISRIIRAKDTSAAVDRALGKLLAACDIVLVTGGISVGKYDFVHPALKKQGVRELFYKVAQKPGKPLFAGRLKNKLIFALPGNPAAVLVCYQEYILPALFRMTGKTPFIFKHLPLEQPFKFSGDRAQFFRAVATDKSVKILAAQDSDNLKSFAEANALVYLSKGNYDLLIGETVEVHPLSPGLF